MVHRDFCHFKVRPDHTKNTLQCHLWTLSILLPSFLIAKRSLWLRIKFLKGRSAAVVTFFSMYSFWAFFLILCAFYEKFQNLLSRQRIGLEMSSYIKATHQSLLEDFFIRLAKLSTFSNMHSAFFSRRKRIPLAFPVSI